MRSHPGSRQLSRSWQNYSPPQLRQLIDQLETIAGIQQGFEELERGQTPPIGDFIQEMQQKYDISG